MKDIDKTLIINELVSPNLSEPNVYDPFYTPSENTKVSENQLVGHKGYFYIESYGC